MDVRKLTLMFGLSAGCAGCITETATVPVTPDTAAKIKNLKEVEIPQRDAKPQTWIALGEVHESKGDDDSIAPIHRNAIRDEARKAYQKATELDPLCIPAHIHLANLFIKQQDSERALGVYQRAIQLNPKSAVLWHEQGIVFCRRQDLNSALKCLGKAHELEPDNRSYSTQYGYCLARAGQPREAVAVLSRTMSKADANFDVARMMMHLNQPDAGRDFVRAALADRPTHPGAQSLMAQLEGPRTSSPIVLGAAQPSTGVNQATYIPPH